MRLSSHLYLSFLLLIITSCNRQLSYNSNQDSSARTFQSSEIDTGDVKMHNGVPVFPVPGSKIENEKIDSVLNLVGLSLFGEMLLSPNPTKGQLGNIRKKLKQLLKKNSVRHDKELLYVFHAMLGTNYIQLYSITKQEKYLHQSEKHVKTAIALLKDEPKYKADLASSYMALVGIYILDKKYDKSISLTKYLIENYQNVGVGPYDNWLASSMVRNLHDFARRFVEKEKAQEIISYLRVASQKYDNEVGIAAEIELARHYYRLGRENKVKALSNNIEIRLKSLNNPEFKEDRWEQFKNYMKLMERRKKRLQQRK